MQSIRSQCREEVDRLATQSLLKKGTFRRKVSSFRKKVFQSLQNVKLRRPEGKSLKKRAAPPLPAAPLLPGPTVEREEQPQRPLPDLVGDPGNRAENAYVTTPREEEEDSSSEEESSFTFPKAAEHAADHPRQAVPQNKGATPPTDGTRMVQVVPRSEGDGQGQDVPGPVLGPGPVLPGPPLPAPRRSLTTVREAQDQTAEVSRAEAEVEAGTRAAGEAQVGFISFVFKYFPASYTYLEKKRKIPRNIDYFQMQTKKFLQVPTLNSETSSNSDSKLGNFFKFRFKLGNFFEFQLGTRKFY